ncbi:MULTISPECIES: hypothetical protein [unclassified Oceanobacillus]|uniref:hypothetical protein n=1 Tax=unclassified Oceanobacillus TaxID=2630292 RepID=UPI00300E4961
MSYEPYPCDNCGKMILSDNDDFHFEVVDRQGINVSNPDACTVCMNCWDTEGYGKEYYRQQELRDLEYAPWLKGVIVKMFSNELLDYVADGDLHAKLSTVEYSTDLREIVTVGQMIKHAKGSGSE